MKDCERCNTEKGANPVPNREKDRTKEKNVELVSFPVEYNDYAWINIEGATYINLNYLDPDQAEIFARNV